MNGLQNIITSGLSPGLHSGLDEGLFNGMRGEVSNRLVYGLKNCTFWLDPADIPGVYDLGRISSWTDKFRNYNYNISLSQPRLILRDSSFNNNPMIDFDTLVRGLKITAGPILNLKTTTLVMIYKYLSPATGSAFQSRVISDGVQTNPRSSGFSYLWSKNNNGSIITTPGFFSASNAGQIVTSATLYNTNAYIIVANTNLWLANNTVLSTNLSGVPSWRINALGGDATSFSGVFKLGEIMLFNKLFTLDESTYITNALNVKYSIF